MDTNTNLLSASQQTLLQILSCQINAKKYVPQQDEIIDFQKIFRESIYQAVPLMALEGIEPSYIDPKTLDTWKQYCTKVLQSTLTVQNHHEFVHELLSSNNIKYCILKGCSSCLYYPMPFVRSMGDVDFLVSKKDLAKVCMLLDKQDFKMWDNNHLCHIVFKKNNMHLEMHFEPAGIPDSEYGDLLRTYLSDIFDKAFQAQVEQTTFITPSKFHHGLVMLMHMYHHMLSEGIGLRHLCDWAVFIKSFEGESFQDIFKDKLCACGLWEFARILSYTCSIYLGIEAKEWMGYPDKTLAFDIINDVFSAGNFGNKDSSRKNQGLIISNRGKNGVSKSAFLQFFKSVNKAAFTEFPIINKYRFLRPFGWIVLGTRYTLRVIFKKRKPIKVSGLVSRAQARKQIYKQFHLFERGEEV